MLEHIDGNGDDVASHYCHQAELDEAIATPYTLEVLSRQNQGRDRKDELRLQGYQDNSRGHELRERTSIRLASQNAAVASVHGFQIIEPGTTTSQGKATVLSPDAPA